MTRSKRELDELVERTAEAIRSDVPSDAAFEQAAARVWARLSAEVELGTGAATPRSGAHDAIEGCADVQALLPALVAGELQRPRALLVEDHARECVPCRRALMAARTGSEAAAAPPPAWSAEDEGPSRAPRHHHWMLAAAAILVAGVGIATLVATGVIGGGSAATAQVASIDGGLYLVSPTGSHALRAGDDVARGQEVRTAKGSGAILVLADGSRVEMRERSELSVAVGRRDTTLDLVRGAVIVEASKRARGHLFVDTEDCQVAVTGTIFSVNHGTKGSRVSVIEGHVRVEQGRREDLLAPGDQVTTRAYLATVPLSQEIAWSRNVDRYLALLAEINALHDELQRTVTAAPPRTSTALLDLAPAATALYAAVPNVAESLSRARQVFHERLEQSPVLRDLLSQSGSLEGQQRLDELIGRIHEFGSYLGDEVALAAVAGGSGLDEHGIVAYAQVLDPPAFRAYLEQEAARLASAGSGAAIHLVDDPAQAGASEDGGLWIWLDDGYVVAAPDARALGLMSASLAGGSSFPASPFHGLLADAYGEGVEWLFAVDLEALRTHATTPPDLLGFENARHLLVRWSEAGDRPEARAVLAFDGPRRGVASWLAAPAPMGSLEFVTPDATAAAAFVVRDPAEMVDELLDMLLARDPNALADLERAEQEQGFDLRQDIAEPLGGEFAVALDGPLAPKPSFKAVVEVYDPARLQQTLTWAIGKLDAQAEARGETGGFALDSEQAGGRTVYHVTTPADVVAVYYTYVDSYLVAAPSRALLDAALSAHETGANLPASDAFRKLLPSDGYANFSAVLYQDVGARLGALTRTLARMQDQGRELTPEEEATVEHTAENNPPSLGYAYGEEDRIVFAASFGGQGPFPLSALLGSGGLNGLAGLEGLIEGAHQDAASEVRSPAGAPTARDGDR